MTTVNRVRRASLLGLAVLLVLLAVGALVAAPQATFHAEGSFAVPAPLTSSGVSRAIRGSKGAVQVSARGERVVVVATTDRDRAAADRRVMEAARRGLDTAGQDTAVAARRRAARATAAAAKAAADTAALTATTGLVDPADAYQERRADLAALERERDAARALGEPIGDLDASIAQTQQEVFDLRLQVQRRDELVQDRARAAQEAAVASATADRATSAALAAEAAVRVADHRTAGWPRVALALGSLVLATAAITASGAMARQRARPRRRKLTRPASAWIRPDSAGSAMTAADAILVEEALAGARSRRAAVAHADERGAVSSPTERVKRPAPAAVIDLSDGSGADAATHHIDLVSEEQAQRERAQPSLGETNEAVAAPAEVSQGPGPRRQPSSRRSSGASRRRRRRR